MGVVSGQRAFETHNTTSRVKAIHGIPKVRRISLTAVYNSVNKIKTVAAAKRHSRGITVMHGKGYEPCAQALAGSRMEKASTSPVRF